MEPPKILPIASMVTVEFGGHALLRFITTDREKLGEFRERSFRPATRTPGYSWC
ncbi:hypothetical protein [Nonomuraea sp. NEAU-A123]|uniref:hypothetical protein n=1 Tax=Nonomuraea sp. NEAU-A123 TaxID=2839649 RepID=UPI001BE43737|nr:hypothetical protein [Nonomuraea sp. NEAU-A123]MBT2235756.1 hypothetical protein [Nonomuraea sp. NEAU-A123]